MNLCDFYLDQTGADFSQLSVHRAERVQPNSLAMAMRHEHEPIISIASSIGSEGPSAYRFRNGAFEVISLQGAFVVDAGDIHEKNALLAMAHPDGGGFYMHISLSQEWSEWDGTPKYPSDFKSKPLSDGSFQPICWRQTFRGQDGFREWVILYLPAPADSIKRRKGHAIIESGGHTFTLPKGEVSDLALKGKIQYALPNEQGNFVFGPVPPHPTDGLMAKIVRDLLSEMGVQKDS